MDEGSFATGFEADTNIDGGADDSVVVVRCWGWLEGKLGALIVGSGSDG
jgi:hypothetical protein